jgi:hypothetical protein
MKSKLLELEGTWEEILSQADQFAGHRVKVIVFFDEELQPNPEDNFRQAWKEIKEGKVKPIDQLWDGIDAK